LRRALVAVALSAALAVFAASALGAQPKPGYRYVGTVKQGGFHAIVFDISRSGKLVQHAKTVGLPRFCEGESPSSTVRFGTAKIKGSGFTTSAKQVVGGKLIAKATLKGKFTSGTGAKGTLKVLYPAESECGGTARFTAIAGGLP
jgi:hypothetical protein